MIQINWVAFVLLCVINVLLGLQVIAIDLELSKQKDSFNVFKERVESELHRRPGGVGAVPQ